MENLDIEKFSNIELSKDDVKSISDNVMNLKIFINKLKIKIKRFLS